MDPIPLVPSCLPEPAWTGGVELRVLLDGPRERVERGFPWMLSLWPIAARLATTRTDRAVHLLPRSEERPVLPQRREDGGVQVAGDAIGVDYLLLEEP